MDIFYCWGYGIMRYTLKGDKKLEVALYKKSKARFYGVANKNLIEIFNRASRPPGTPRKNGDLIKSRRLREANPSTKFKGVFYYTMEYAPHVEYGHRVGKNGYVKGRRYLKKNVDRQKRIYKQDLIKELKR